MRVLGILWTLTVALSVVGEPERPSAEVETHLRAIRELPIVEKRQVVENGTSYTLIVRKNETSGETIEVKERFVRAPQPKDPREDISVSADGIYACNERVFRQLLATQNNLLVFFRPPTDYVRRFSQLAKEVNQTKLPVTLATLRPMFFEDLSAELNVQVPSLVLYRHYGNQSITYNQPYDTRDHNWQHMYRWLLSRLGSGIRVLINKPMVDVFVRENKNTAVFFLASLNHSFIRELEDSSLHFDLVNVAVVVERKVAKEFNVEGKNVLHFFPSYSSEKVVFPRLARQDEWSNQAISDFLLVHQYPAVIEQSPRDFPELLSPTILYHAYCFAHRNDPDFDDIINEFRLACEKFREKIMCSYIDMDLAGHTKFATINGVRVQPGFPRQSLTVTPQDPELETRPKYRPFGSMWMDGRKEVNPERSIHLYMKATEYEAFFKRILAKKVEPFFITEPDAKEDENIPVEGTEKAKYGTPKLVHKIVGKHWRKVAKERTKTAVIYFTGSWCLGCNHTIHHRLVNLARHFALAGRTDLVFGFSDYERNEYPGLKATKMPRLKLFPKNSDDELDYEETEKYCNLKVWIESLGKYWQCDKNRVADPEDEDVSNEHDIPRDVAGSQKLLHEHTEL